MFASRLSSGLALLPFVTAAVHDVWVGGEGGKLVYEPEAFSAQPGDQVTFHFNPKNHTVSQSAFDNPCGLKEGGFDSGFIPVQANTTDAAPTYTIQVNDTQPIWVYCRQAGGTAQSHCGQGMVMSVNCPLDPAAPNSFQNFKAKALEIGASLSASAAAASSTGYGGGGYGYGESSAATNTWTAAYGDYTVPAEPDSTPVTQVISVESEVWTTTYNSYPGSPAATPASLQGQVHRVIVGGSDGLVFNPARVDALPRDVITFEFHQKNHTVTQSSFADPCRKLDANGTVGFDSGFIPVAEGETTFPTWSITVNSTEPLWAYCRQKTPASHCGAGMVFAINSVEDSERSFSAFQNVAKAINGSADTSSTPSGSESAAGSTPTDGASSVGNGMSLAAAMFVVMMACML